MAKQNENDSPSVKRNEEFDATFSSKKMLKENAEKGTKIKYNDRLKVEIIQQTQFYKIGQVINPAKVKGQALIDQKIAKKFVPKED